jgi:hypothetical protein
MADAGRGCIFAAYESSNVYLPISLPPAGDQDHGLVSHQQPIAIAPYL